MDPVWGGWRGESRTKIKQAQSTQTKHERMTANLMSKFKMGGGLRKCRSVFRFLQIFVNSFFQIPTKDMGIRVLILSSQNLHHKAAQRSIGWRIFSSYSSSPIVSVRHSWSRDTKEKEERPKKNSEGFSRSLFSKYRRGLPYTFGKWFNSIRANPMQFSSPRYMTLRRHTWQRSEFDSVAVVQL